MNGYFQTVLLHAKNIYMKKGLFTLLLSIVSVMLLAQGILTGNVYDKKDHVPLAGANIYLPEIEKGTVTDARGNYTIGSLPKGEWLVTVSYIGYTTKISKVNIQANKQILNVALSPKVIQGEEVVISGNFTGRQHVNTVKINTLEKKALVNVASPSFIKAIASIPGVDMISKGPGVGTPVIRGLSTSNILFLNNGIPMENFQFSENHPYLVDESDIGRVEVIKGPASLLYGSGAVGGVINLIPYKPLSPGNINGKALFKYFSNTKGLEGILGIRGTNKSIAWGLSSHVASNKDYVDGNQSRVPNSRFNTNSIKANIGVLKKIGSFKLFGEYSQNKLGLTVPPAIHSVTNNERKNSIWYQNLSNLFVQSKNNIYFGNVITNIDLAWQQNHRRLQTSQELPFFTSVDMLLNAFHYSIRSTIPVRSSYKFSVGAQGKWQNNKNNEAPSHVLPNATINELSAFVLGQYQTDKINIETGLRYTYYHLNVPSQPKGLPSTPLTELLIKNYNNVSYSLGATYHFSEHLLVRANLASAFRSPNLAELTQDGVHAVRYEKGNPNLKTQHNTEGDLGLHLHTAHATVDVSGFYNHVSNYIYLSPSVDSTESGLPIYYYQQAQAVLFGGEAKVHVHPRPLNWLHFMADWSYVVGKKVNGGYLPFIPAQKFRFEIKIEKQKWSGLKNSFVKIGANVVLAQNNAAQFETSTPGYWLLDAGIGTNIEIGKQLVSLSIEGNNLLNKTYQDHLSTLKPLGIYDMGRNIAMVLTIPIGVKN